MANNEKMTMNVEGYIKLNHVSQYLTLQRERKVMDVHDESKQWSTYSAGQDVIRKLIRQMEQENY